ncbi:MAG: hypothetical protein QNJ62_06660 [Methyloceanibacter sp.]|nr:hypothetical protein [Methyloceanibacter sp.]
MNTSPALNAKTRTPLEALHDLMDQAENLARHVMDATDHPDLIDAMQDFIHELPLDRLRDAEEAETKASYQDAKAMYRPPSV